MNLLDNWKLVPDEVLLTEAKPPNNHCDNFQLGNLWAARCREMTAFRGGRR